MAIIINTQNNTRINANLKATADRHAARAKAARARTGQDTAKSFRLATQGKLQRVRLVALALFNSGEIRKPAVAIKVAEQIVYQVSATTSFYGGWSSSKAIAEACGCSQYAVDRAVATLCKAKLITWRLLKKGQPGKGRAPTRHFSLTTRFQRLLNHVLNGFKPNRKIQMANPPKPIATPKALQKGTDGDNPPPSKQGGNAALAAIRNSRMQNGGLTA
jgi:predicted transcriptional regulator